MGHEDTVPAAYMVTDLASGDVIALCSGCMVELGAGMVRGVGGTVTMPGQAEPEPSPEPAAVPAIMDAPLPEMSAAESNQAAADAANDEARAEARVLAHQERTRGKLAARPDSAPTSETVVPWPSVTRSDGTTTAGVAAQVTGAPREPDGDATD
jgi:hypothetical protein